MKKLVVLILLSILFITGNFGKNPPGTVPVDENLYVDQYEVSNVNWREYINWIKVRHGVNSKEYKAALPDTLVWRKPKAYNEPYVEFYHKHPAYQNYPVVGISYEQAVAFCKWRSDRVNEKIYIKENKIDYKPGDVFPNAPVVFQYRLPAKSEWEKIAKVGYSERMAKKLKRKKYQEVEKHNYLNDDDTDTEEMNRKGDITAKTDAYWPNALGVYNLLGNVAEMVAEKGIAKGGSWIHKEKEVTVEKDFQYHKPADWVGFRCVCEKVK
jgi:formylglycine-generating enzyme required for sulfatase activity